MQTATRDDGAAGALADRPADTRAGGDTDTCAGGAAAPRAAVAADAIAAVVLAAGAGERLGRRPKCLLELDGVPLIARLLDALEAAGIAPIVVVSGHHAERIEPLLRARGGVAIVRNPDPDAGQVASQRLGLAALPQGPQAVLIALADQPLLDARDLRALQQAWRARPAGAQVVHPVVVEATQAAAPGEVDGVRGNPVVCAAEVRAQVLAAGVGFGCRQWQAAHPDRVWRFVTANRHYAVDLDTPDDLQRFERETGRALRWPPGLQA